MLDGELPCDLPVPDCTVLLCLYKYVRVLYILYNVFLCCIFAYVVCDNMHYMCRFFVCFEMSSRHNKHSLQYNIHSLQFTAVGLN